MIIGLSDCNGLPSFNSLNLLIKTFNINPKKYANAVSVITITLYGMLKSGVASGANNS